ncbi:MAG: class I SAM-dependent RNA methyltransferase [Pseudomonadota bacterium]
MEPLDIFAMAPPGLEPVLAQEMHAAGFPDATVVPGGVTIRGGWPDVWRANLLLRGAGRVTATIAGFRAMHLAQLDKRARKIDWRAVLRADVPVRVEASCRKSRIYHAGAAQQRIEGALDAAGIPVAAGAPVTLRARIEDDWVLIAVDTSGEPLHRRGYKTAVGKAPLRETMAALFLRACGYLGQEPVLDPMCGSGTFVIEAAEIAAGLAPGRARAFAFEHLAGFDADAWAAMRTMPPTPLPDLRFHGSDRDAGAFARARDNAARAGVAPITSFEKATISEIAPPDGPPGLVIANPPYGTRIGDKKALFPLYGALGTSLRARFSGWRVGIVTSDAGLAKATGLPFDPPGPVVPHGGLKVRLWQTAPLP